MSLADKFNEGPPSKVDYSRPRASVPAPTVGWKIDPDSQDLVEVTGILSEVPADEESWRAQITKITGMTVPVTREVILTDVRQWGDPQAPSTYCKWVIKDRPDVAAENAFDAVAILHKLRHGRHSTAKRTLGSSSFVLSWNDWQIGKSGEAGGGTQQTVERIDSALEAAAKRIRTLRRAGISLGHLVILGIGDIVEGCFIYPHQSFSLDMDRRSQTNAATTIILDGIDRLAPMFDKVSVMVVPGNHGENRVNGKMINGHDNDDCKVFEDAARVADRDSRLSHVEWNISDWDVAKTMEVNGWVLGITHGQVYGKGNGGDPGIKAWNWFKNQAASGNPVGSSDLFVTAHFHHDSERDHGRTLWKQVRAIDGGSRHFEQVAGDISQPGMNSWVMTDQERMRESAVLK